MITLRKSADRGRTRTHWLDSRHSFSFAGYDDPAWRGFRALRVLNEDRVAADSGFGPHPHRDMEILTLVLGGAIEHRDSEGNRSLLAAGALQRMSAGTGIVHSEWNPSHETEAHFLQIWIHPEARGLQPSFEERRFGPALARPGEPVLLASGDGRDGSLTLRQDLTLHALGLGTGASHRAALRPGRNAWLQLLHGRVLVNGIAAETGDGIAVSGEERVEITAEQDAGLLLFDLA